MFFLRASIQVFDQPGIANRQVLEQSQVHAFRQVMHGTVAEQSIRAAITGRRAYRRVGSVGTVLAGVVLQRLGTDARADAHRDRGGVEAVIEAVADGLVGPPVSFPLRLSDPAGPARVLSDRPVRL